MNKSKTKGTPLEPELIEALKAFVNEHGEPEACKRLELSRQTVGRAMGGLSVWPSTAGQIRMRLIPGRASRAT